MIPLSKPYIPEFTFDDGFKEHLFSDYYASKTIEWVKSTFQFHNVILTSSCTTALEMCSLLLNLQENDEVIIPGYTFVSTANAFALRKPKLIFADVHSFCPVISLADIQRNTSKKTKAIIIVHYAGITYELDLIAKYCKENSIVLIEDAAHSIGAKFKKNYLGSYGDLATFSFDKTKNISCHKGGMLVINDNQYLDKSRIIKECGTNKLSTTGKIDSPYEWIDLGSTFSISSPTAFILYHSLKETVRITKRRLELWNTYFNDLLSLQEGKYIQLPYSSKASKGNGHIFYFLVINRAIRDSLIANLNRHNIGASFHYLPLNESPFAKSNGIDKKLRNTTKFSDTLIRLPLYYSLTDDEQQNIVEIIKRFFKNN